MNIVSKSIARTIQYKVNAKLPPFDDVKFRQILSRAIDHQGISEQVLKIDGGMANQILPPIFADWQINAPNSTPDYDALQQKLAKLGYQKDGNGKLLGKDGKAVAFTLKTFSDRPELPIVATTGQAVLAKAHLAMCYANSSHQKQAISSGISNQNENSCSNYTKTHRPPFQHIYHFAPCLMM